MEYVLFLSYYYSMFSTLKKTVLAVFTLAFISLLALAPSQALAVQITFHNNLPNGYLMSVEALSGVDKNHSCVTYSNDFIYINTFAPYYTLSFYPRDYAGVDPCSDKTKWQNYQIAVEGKVIGTIQAKCAGDCKEFVFVVIEKVQPYYDWYRITTGPDTVSVSCNGKCVPAKVGPPY